ncbi:MAG TPA: NlpC/P60 family protein, partial [Rhodocyclaceae bacterium]|nr:NlpC/P60 family protein [Rhodocyclaceae bacterium]
QSAGLQVSGSAAQIARQGRKIPLDASRAGDLVFFNTRGGPYTHVGIYLGDGRFVHAPSSTSGKVRVDSLRSGYFAARFSEARAYFD